MVVHDEQARHDVVVNFNGLTTLKSSDRSLSTLKDLRPGTSVSIMDSLTASKVTGERSISFGSRGDPCCSRKCLPLKMIPASRLVVRT